ncbi:OmpA family protein [Robiginitalea aurantiaca]|uniref:OmpA family protein n=1 Tax=Robiginitalea aurantiaca TaxID=3056915 RepID=A0ABT7WI19_9FLAO|nr:OmpA family protein [Robiginitalea aurantiaca]MDM9632564.1 OmpA family protein [Robiginitalea aurantiaca]
MLYRINYALVVILLAIYPLMGQELPTALPNDTIPQLTKKDSLVTSYWLAGLGINIVDDSWRARQNYALSEMWNTVPYPSRLSFGRYFKSGIGLELIGTYNKFKEGKVIDGQPITEESEYWAVDSRISYDLNRLVGETGIFDPYIGAGLGYTQTEVRRRTANAIIGFRLWFSERWGADLNSTGKWGLESESTNHIQHGAGVVYRFGMEKELTKKGAEKLALIEAMKAEEQRVADSIQNAEELSRKRALEEQLRREEALAAAEAARQQEEAEKREALKRELEDLGSINFAFDSANLTNESKETLRRTAAFMEKNSALSFSLSAHTDSRGPAAYNQLLSQRRADRTKEFLVGQGVRSDRILTSAHGETQLLNSCADGVRCTEEEHAINRRVEIVIQDY